MELVEATVEDLDALVTRWYALAKAIEAHDELNDLSDASVDEVADDGFRAHLDDETVTDYLVVHEEVTIGFVTLREGHHPSRKHSHYLRIVNLVIDDDHRNRGHGTDVVERVKEIARDRGCDHLKVSCEWHNEGARRFYRDTEFRPKQVDYVQPIE
ncbi:GNAT family N-acetyltransferase [Halapricum hydrolyticum]|uniref:GNAT family N-acetyltransferase n=1 Tax=Halapricum hydrolyticum TaxID=2979991 RepID=A0AAE3IA83_9EURY|nr:GNAT family N-acetyltransferase [Halapricum hydrolyticum]MCU4717730.1 GNAT family N-acetyltransferase [Halapricum hydrolyticum]MCU4726741.1 GNAT family N-acetyltransferase [Halapricum hydrolyticum]